jgi:hypothetical protein
MARKQAIVKETVAAAAPKTARAAKPKTPRVTAAKHSKSVSTESTPAQTGADVATANDTEVIAKIAYSYWESRGGHGGSALEDWVRAEREYVDRHVKRASA